ncbi:MAG: ferredoxin [Rhodospirillales bacterium]|nr:ferredoxin [Rhodospirillales bacterium]
MHYSDIETALASHGLLARGAFAADAEDGLGDAARCLVMVGNVGSGLWRFFADQRRDEPDAMNRWSRRVIDPIAERFAARAIYPFDGPPWFPFQRWAQRAEPVYPSPIGMLIHPDYGLWHAYRGALVFDRAVEGLPRPDDRPSPCEICADKPCLVTCPVNAFSGERYDVPTCADHLSTPEGADCMALGCRARRSCPAGQDTDYLPEQAAFHMTAFLGSR